MPESAQTGRPASWRLTRAYDLYTESAADGHAGRLAEDLGAIGS